jgi:hypothetical protein
LRERLPKPHLDFLPIIEPGAFQFAVVDGKSKRFNQMECRPRGETKPSDVAGIRRNLGLDEDDVKRAGVMECGSNGVLDYNGVPITPLLHYSIASTACPRQISRA